MFTKVPLKNVSRENWLELRRTGIGGSDAAVIMGESKYKSTLDLYSEKTMEPGLTFEDKDSETLRVGRDLEDYVARRFCEATGKKVVRSNFMYRSKTYPYMLADVDRLVVGEDAGLECKTVNAFGEGKWKDGQIPKNYVMQCYHYMAVTGRKTWYIAALIMGIGFVYQKLEWDDEIINALIRKEAEFWALVEKRIPPAPDGTEPFSVSLSNLYPKAEVGSRLDMPEFFERLQLRDRLIKEAEELEKQKALIEQEIQVTMEDCETARCGPYMISWKNVETNRLDTKALKAKEPAVYEQYLSRGSARRFSIKVA